MPVPNVLPPQQCTRYAVFVSGHFILQKPTARSDSSLPSSSPPRLWPSWEHERMPPHLDPRSSYTLCIAEDPKPDAEFRRRRNSLAMTKIEEAKLDCNRLSFLPFPPISLFSLLAFQRQSVQSVPLSSLFPLNPFPIFAVAPPPGTEGGRLKRGPLFGLLLFANPHDDSQFPPPFPQERSKTNSFIML